ncbi:MAG: PAS domain S-box protein, partial [Rhodocyclaceae bacterium]
PRAAQWAPQVKAGIALLLGLLGATLVSVWGGLSASRRLGRAVASLAQRVDGVPRSADIAEIRQVHGVLDEARAKLRQSEERFRRLFDATPLAMFHVGADESIVARNTRFDRLFGYAEADLPSLPDWWRLAGPDGSNRNRITAHWKAAVARAARTGADIEAGEEELVCKDGSRRIVEITGIALKPGVLIAFADVTERRRAEGDLRLWAEAFEQAELALAIGDARSNTLVAVNPAFARERGFEPAEMAGMPIPRLFPGDRSEEARAMIAALDATSHGVFELEHLTKEGRRFPVLLDITVLRDGQGKPFRRVAYALDLTERKRTEQALADTQAAALAQQKRARLAALNQMQDASAAREKAEAALAALRESEGRLRAIYENAVAGIALIDADGRIEQGNPALCAMLGYAEDVLRRRDPVSLVHPDDRAALQAQMARLWSGEMRRFEMELRYLHHSGRIVWLHEFSSLLSESAHEPVRLVTLVTDITEKKRTEAELQRLNTELERRVAERTAELTAANRELDSFAYAVSHDLRAPLRAMSGFSQALLEDFGAVLPGAAKEYIDHIGLASRKMSDLIDGLLTLSRCTRGNLRRDAVDISALAARRLEALTQAEPERNVAWQVEPGLAAAGDGRMIEVLLENLLNNACKYTGQTPKPEIRVHTCELDGQPAICVADNGAGFDMDHAGRMFEPFQRLHRQDEFPGIGIGLATVQRIVQRHGGKIVARGKPGK